MQASSGRDVHALSHRAAMRLGLGGLSTEFEGHLGLAQSLLPVVAVQEIARLEHGLFTTRVAGSEEPGCPPDLRRVPVRGPAGCGLGRDRELRLRPGRLLVALDQSQQAFRREQRRRGTRITLGKLCGGIGEDLARGRWIALGSDDARELGCDRGHERPLPEIPAEHECLAQIGLGFVEPSGQAVRGTPVAEGARELPPSTQLAEGSDRGVGLVERFVEAKQPAERRRDGLARQRRRERLAGLLTDGERLEADAQGFSFVGDG